MDAPGAWERTRPSAFTAPERGMIELRMEGRWPTAQFAPEDLAALRPHAQDRRELGLDVAGSGCAEGERPGGTDAAGARIGRGP